MQRIGLLAGSGRFPILFAEAAKRQGLQICCVGVRYEASESELRPLCERYEVVSVSRLGGMIRAFRRMGVDRIVMAGKIHKQVMHTPMRVIRLWPDLRMIRFWCRKLKDKRDDSILLGVIREFERDGMTYVSALDYCPELLVNQGILTRRRPTPAEWADIRFGWRLAKEMGRLDVGQSVAVKECAALAIEAIEGTDRCIERAGQLCRAGGWTLVKVAKPQQDMRFDVPTIGVSTIENLKKAGAKVLAIEAGMTIVVDQADVVALAERYGITIVSVEANELAIADQSTLVA